MRKSHHDPPLKQLNMKSMTISLSNKTITVMIRGFVLFLFWNLTPTIDGNYKNCRERDRPIEDEKDDLYELVDATPGQKIMLQCHYCNENDDEKPKIWYQIKDFGSLVGVEVPLDMSNNPVLNKIHVNKEHTLTIHNFTKEDIGLYYCQRLEESEHEKFNYLVDQRWLSPQRVQYPPQCTRNLTHKNRFKLSKKLGCITSQAISYFFDSKVVVYESNATSVERGNFSTWRKYYEEHLVPLNTLLSQSQGIEFLHVRIDLNIEMEATTQWRPWGICQVCGRPQHEGIRKRVGFCRLKLIHKKENTSSSSQDEFFLQYTNGISCGSQVLGRLLPGISNLTRIIPNFIQIQHCEGTCNPDAEGLSRGWKAGKTSAFKYRKTFVLAENSHITIVCPESTLENKVTWKRNGKVLAAGESVVPKNMDEEPRILVDTFNTLYLVDVQASEEGNYTCQVDNIRMQQIIIYVVSKSKILTQAFARHMMYLGLVLSLTLPCYCAGVVIACSKKRTFKGYQELKEMENESQRYRLVKFI